MRSWFIPRWCMPSSRLRSIKFCILREEGVHGLELRRTGRGEENLSYIDGCCLWNGRSKIWWSKVDCGTCAVSSSSFILQLPSWNPFRRMFRARGGAFRFIEFDYFGSPSEECPFVWLFMQVQAQVQEEASVLADEIMELTTTDEVM